MHGEPGIETGKVRDKMILPDPDGPFGRILVMVVGRNKLESNVGGAHELLEPRGTFIVEFLELGFESTINQMLMQVGVGTYKFLLGSVFDGFCQDGRRIIIVNDHDVLVAFAGRDRKTSGLVRENLPFDFHDRGIHKMGSDGRLGR